MPKIKAANASLFFVSALLLVACGHTSKPGEVALNWSCKLRELQIQPTFPPREDLQVGDMFLHSVDESVQGIASTYCDPSTLDEFMPIPVFLGSVPNMARELNAFYKTRIDAPKTTKGQLSINNEKVTIAGFEIPEGSDASIFDSTNLKRFRQVGFPDFMAVKVSGAELGAIVPIHGVMSDLGFGTEAVESATISVPAAESYGLPASVIHKSFRDAWTDENSTCKGKALKLNGLTYSELKAMTPRPEKRNGSPAAANPDILVTVVREVFATRAIDSSISFKQSFVAGINHDKSKKDKNGSSGDVASDGKQSSANDNGVMNDSSPPPSSPEAARRADAKALGAAVTEAIGKRQGVPGVTFNVRTSSSHGVGLTRVFDRPVVIGYRGISYRIKLVDGSNDCMEILVAQPSGPITIAPASSSIKDK